MALLMLLFAIKLLARLSTFKYVMKQMNEIIFLMDKLAIKTTCCYRDSLFQFTFKMLYYEYIYIYPML